MQYRSLATLSAALLLAAGCAKPPKIVSVEPAENAAQVQGDAVIRVTFDGPVDPASAASGLTVQADGAAVKGEVSVRDASASFTSAAGLPHGAVIQVTVASNVRSAKGKVLGETKTWTFSTEPASHRYTHGKGYVEGRVVYVEDWGLVGSSGYSEANFELQAADGRIFRFDETGTETLSPEGKSASIEDYLNKEGYAVRLYGPKGQPDATKWPSFVRAQAVKLTAPPPEPAATAVSKPTPKVGAEFVEPYTGMAMVCLPGASFAMGDPMSESTQNRAAPAHPVILSDFCIGKYEVTQTQWKKVMGSNPSEQYACPECPVEQVSWQAAQDFTKRLASITGMGYSLPTEAQWEFAARSGGKPEQWAGTSEAGQLSRFAWLGGDQKARPQPVGGKQANGAGLYDMTGNVMEWVLDDSNSEYYRRGPLVDPVNLDDASEDEETLYRSTPVKVLRGGAVGSRSIDASTWQREPANFLDASPKTGLRVALSLLGHITIRKKDSLELFSSFLSAFKSDADLQRSRISFPLPVVDEDPAGVKGRTIDRANWKHVGFSKVFGIQRITPARMIVHTGEPACSESYVFEARQGEWFLTENRFENRGCGG